MEIDFYHHGKNWFFTAVEIEFYHLGKLIFTTVENWFLPPVENWLLPLWKIDFYQYHHGKLNFTTVENWFLTTVENFYHPGNWFFITVEIDIYATIEIDFITMIVWPYDWLCLVAIWR